MEQNLNGTANHCTGRIPLEGLPNTRDIGVINIFNPILNEETVGIRNSMWISCMKIADLVREKTKDVRLAECVKVLLTVSEDYIRHAFSAMETACGSVEAYLNDRIGLNERKQAELKRKFLI